MNLNTVTRTSRRLIAATSAAAFDQCLRVLTSYKEFTLCLDEQYQEPRTLTAGQYESCRNLWFLIVQPGDDWWRVEKELKELEVVGLEKDEGSPYLYVEQERGFSILAGDDHYLWPPKKSTYCSIDSRWHERTRVDQTDAKGRGVRVSILDSGFANSRKLQSACGVIEVWNVVDNASHTSRQQGPWDTLGHGTAMASIVGARDLRDMSGTAPQAKIISIRTYEDTSVYDSHTLRGLCCACCRAEEAGGKGSHSIILTPYGVCPAENEEYSPVFEAVTQRLQELGHWWIAAAGNDSCTQHPANCPSILAIGAIRSARSSYEMALGSGTENIAFVGPGHGVAALHYSSLLAAPCCGTSPASAYVAGLLACHLEDKGGKLILEELRFWPPPPQTKGMPFGRGLLLAPSADEAN